MPTLWTSEGERFFISDSCDLLKFDDIQTFLHSVPAFQWITLSTWNEMVKNSSTVFGVYDSAAQAQGTGSTSYLRFSCVCSLCSKFIDLNSSLEPKQIGCARLVSDKSRFTWLDHMFILPPYRGLGLGKALLSVIVLSQEFTVGRQAVNCWGSKALYNLLIGYGGFSIIHGPDSNEAAFMYKLIYPLDDLHDSTSTTPTSSNDDAQRLAWVPHATLANYYASTSREFLDMQVIQAYLDNSYWAKGITLENVIMEVQNSVCLGLYYQEPNGE
jgi:GNAT superfamily N-acetyltransferase